MTGQTNEFLMGMLQANPFMVKNREFMEDLMKNKQVEAQMQ
jgi:hypothetical protein